MCDVEHLFKVSSVNLASWWNKIDFLARLPLIIQNKIGQYMDNSQSRESFRFYDMVTVIYLQRGRAQIIKNTFITERERRAAREDGNQMQL